MKNLRQTSLAAACVLIFTAGIQNTAAAETGNDDTYENPPYYEIDRMLTEKALESGVPPEILKAVAHRESDWRQFNTEGEPNISSDGGIGLMQITDEGFDEERLKYDIEYNIETAIEVLKEKQTWSGSRIPQINDGDPEYLDHWYFKLMAYNGLVHANSPIVRATGERNDDAYQEQIYGFISEYNHNMPFSELPIELSDLDYRDNYQLGFNTLQLSMNETLLQPSRYYVEDNDLVAARSSVNLRSEPTRESNRVTTVPEGEILQLQGDFSFDASHEYGVDLLSRQYIWYNVEMEDGTEGYVAAAYTDLLNIGLVDLSEIPDSDTNLTDIDDHWAHSSIDRLNSKGKITGYNDNTFRPNDDITRAEFTAIVNRLLTGVPDIEREWVFDDAPVAWAEDDIVTGTALRLLTGNPDNTFRPNNAITRTEIAVILDRLVNLTGYEAGTTGEAAQFSDALPAWAEGAITRMAEAGIISGNPDGTFRPYNNASRAEVATMLDRMLD